MDSEYIVIEPDYKNRQTYWQIAKNLQEVDYLKTSEYLDIVAEDTIKGKYEIKEAVRRVDSYYSSKPRINNNETEEADKVAVRIVGFLERKAFSFSPAVLKSIHRELFSGVLKDEWVGHYRKVNLFKHERVLNGKSVQYADHSAIEDTLRYDFELQKDVNYSLPLDLKQIEAMTRFTSNIWQIHPFREGNTRTIATFTISRLVSMGLDVNNDPFKENAQFFRDALVRANYSSIQDGIREDLSFLNKFFENVLLDAKHDLSRLDLRCLPLFALDKKERLAPGALAQHATEKAQQTQGSQDRTYNKKHIR